MEPVVRSPYGGPERRNERRTRTLKSATIAFNLGRSVIDCTVRNISPRGALIEVQSVVGVPMQFEMIMDHGATRRACTVRWHTERMIGVGLDDAGQKAA
jgi:hypothetical protein